jgi:SAM-dependent methyltransferase
MSTEETGAENYFLFTTGWRAYKAILDYDYLWHSMAAAELNRQLLERFGRDRPFTFLDLACGDAWVTAGVLKDFPLAKYTGVDSSREALKEAERYVGQLGPGRRLEISDYLEFLENATENFDVIYVGLVAHHLGEAGLARFFRGVKKRLAPGGVLMAYETFLLADETRDEHTGRLCRMIRQFWSEMPQEYRQFVVDHVTTSDFPVSFQVWNEKATREGLGAMRVLTKTPDRLLAFALHQAI